MKPGGFVILRADCNCFIRKINKDPNNLLGQAMDNEEEIDEMLRDMDIDEQGMLSIEQALSVLFVGDYTE